MVAINHRQMVGLWQCGTGFMQTGSGNPVHLSRPMDEMGRASANEVALMMRDPNSSSHLSMQSEAQGQCRGVAPFCSV